MDCNPTNGSREMRAEDGRARNSDPDQTCPERKALFGGVRRVVLKLGTRLVTQKDHSLNIGLIERLAADVAELRRTGIQVAVVSSGAVGAGMGRLGLAERPRRLSALQATAAVGQGLLMNAYKLAFRIHAIPVGQVLLTADDLDNRRRYVNARNTLDSLFRFGVVPVLNENDSVAVEELQLSVGDNDRLSALVAHLIDADLLVILTDVDGFFSEDPDRRRDARLIARVEEVRPEMLERAGRAGSAVSLGGMRSKLEAAQSVTRGGRLAVIANGHKIGLSRILAGAPAGTLFLAARERLPGRKLWIANSRRNGAVVVDDGAVEAIVKRGKSLLPSGILKVEGAFEAGELIAVEDRRRTEVARGVVRYGSGDVQRILGKSTGDVFSILDVESGGEVVHRDDLVVL
ncbi:MAG: glutamate 5-kinase [Gemmatimonadota bacterium]|nr:glutamate 5-kinase [Gemmatimonadota bacterium]